MDKKIAKQDLELVWLLNLYEMPTVELVAFPAVLQKMPQEVLGVKSRPLPLAVHEERTALRVGNLGLISHDQGNERAEVWVRQPWPVACELEVLRREGKRLSERNAGRVA